MRQKGKLRSWNDAKGYGFIESGGEDKDIFVHITAFGDRERRPEVGEEVTYTLVTDDQGRPRAADASLPGQGLGSLRSPGGQSWVLVVAGLYLVAVVIAALTDVLPNTVMWIYLLLSFATFVAYAADKNAAQQGGWRQSEAKLHLFALVGGWPGGLIAQQSLRHKNRKDAFQRVFWVTVAINVALLVWVATPYGEGLADDARDAARSGLGFEPAKKRIKFTPVYP